MSSQQMVTMSSLQFPTQPSIDKDLPMLANKSILITRETRSF
jgi:hypothetical protein